MKPAYLLLLAVLFAITLSINVPAQRNAALPFLTYPVSPENAGMGNTGTSLPSHDVFGFLANPAQLGYSSQKMNLAFQLYPQATEIQHLINYNSLALNTGYNFNKLIHFPVSVGFGFNRTTDEPNFLTGTNNKEIFDSYSLGVGVDYYVQFSIGYTHKSISSTITDLSADVSAYDIGFLLNVPITNLLLRGSKINFVEGLDLSPEMNFAIGYAQANIGDKIYYIDPAQADPLPRTARLGYSVSAGLNESSLRYPLKLINFDFTVDAEDYLILRDTQGNTSYQSSFGDLNIGRNILGIKGDDKVYSHAGFKIGLLETVDLLRGHLGSANNIYSTNGYVIKARGLFKVLAGNSQNPALNFMAQHLDINYYSSVSLVDSPAEVSFKGIEVMLSNFDFN